MSWINSTKPGEGYTLDLHHVEKHLFYSTNIYQFKLSNPPLQWIYSDQTIIEPCKLALTDLGSIPFLARWYIPCDLCPRAFIFHDIAYRNGFWWGVREDGTSYRRICSRLEADITLYNMALKDGATKAQAIVIYNGVRIGGAPKWIKCRLSDNIRKSIDWEK